MKLLVISPDSSDAREIVSVREMFGRGLERYHVRKPLWSASKMSEWLSFFTADERKKIVLHGHADLVLKFGLLGVHWSDDSHVPINPERKFGFRSRACHDLLNVRKAWGHFETVLLSPVFPSISKPGYGTTRAWTDREITALLTERDAAQRVTEVFALGGIDESTTRRVRAMGFDGVAALGAVWQSKDPVGAFEKLSETCRENLPSESNIAARQSAVAFSISS